MAGSGLFSERPQLFMYTGRTASLPSLRHTPPLAPPARPTRKPSRQQVYPTPLPFLKPRPQTPAQGVVYWTSVVGFRNGEEKHENQDAFFHMCEEDCRLIGVCDGHGVHGKSVAACLSSKLSALFYSYSKAGNSAESALCQAYHETNRQLGLSGLDCRKSGSTCTAVVLQGKSLICSNVGNSRAVLGRCSHGVWSVFQLSWDHTPEDPEERARIQAAGGEVVVSKTCNAGPMRVYMKGRAFPGLAMTRALGDWEAAPAGIICTPDLEAVQLTPRDRFLLLATDGLWAVMSSFEAVHRVAVGLSQPELLCGLLVAEAQRRWRLRGSLVDDITVVIACLRP